MLTQIQKLSLKGKFLFEENNDFLMFKLNIKMPDEGFKIHISANVKNWQEIISASFPVLLDLEGSFKIIKNLNCFYSSFNMHKNNLLGKLITIYPKDLDEFLHISEKLKVTLNGFKSPIAPSDRWIPDCETVSYRYGSFNSYRLKNGEIDSRNSYNLPDNILDPFDAIDSSANYMQGKKDKYFLAKLLSDKPYSKVLLVENENNQKFVMKEVKKNFSISKDVFAYDLRKNEFEISKKLIDKISIANPIEEINGKFSSFFIYEYIEKLDFDFNLLIGTKKNINKVESLLNELIAYIEKIWELGFFINDIKANNFIYSKEKGWVFLDWELSSEKNVPLMHVATKFNQTFLTEEQIEKTKVVEMMFDLLFSINFYDGHSSINEIMFILNKLMNKMMIDSNLIKKINKLMNYENLQYADFDQKLSRLTKLNKALFTKVNKMDAKKILEEYYSAPSGELVFMNNVPYMYDGKNYNPHINGGTLALMVDQFRHNKKIHDDLLSIFELNWTYKNGKNGLYSMILFCVLLDIKDYRFNEKIECFSLNNLFGTGGLDE